MNIFASKYSNIFEFPNIRYTLYQSLTIMWPLHSMTCAQLLPYIPARTVKRTSLVTGMGPGLAVVVRGVVGLYL